MFGRDRRTERRYYFQQPAFVVGLQDVNCSEVETVTENVSTHGLLLRCKVPIALGSKIRVIVRFPSRVPIEGVGDVLRVEQPSAGGAFLIAVRCEEPLKISR
jgi:PilZ domain